MKSSTVVLNPDKMLSREINCGPEVGAELVYKVVWPKVPVIADSSLAWYFPSSSVVHSAPALFMKLTSFIPDFPRYSSEGKKRVGIRSPKTHERKLNEVPPSAPFGFCATESRNFARAGCRMICPSASGMLFGKKSWDRRKGDSFGIP